MLPPVLLSVVATALAVVVVVRALGKPQATAATVLLLAITGGCALFWYVAARDAAGWQITATRVVWFVVLAEALILFVAVRRRQEPPHKPPPVEHEARINRARWATRTSRKRYRFVE